MSALHIVLLLAVRGSCAADFADKRRPSSTHTALPEAVLAAVHSRDVPDAVLSMSGKSILTHDFTSADQSGATATNTCQEIEDNVQGSVEHFTPPRIAALDRPERSTLNKSSMVASQLVLLMLFGIAMGLKLLTQARRAAYARMHAATLIQAACRGFAARSDFNNFLEVSAAWVGAARSVQLRWRYKCKCHRAAVHIQSWARQRQVYDVLLGAAKCGQYECIDSLSDLQDCGANLILEGGGGVDLREVLRDLSVERRASARINAGVRGYVVRSLLGTWQPLRKALGNKPLSSVIYLKVLTGRVLDLVIFERHTGDSVSLDALIAQHGGKAKKKAGRAKTAKHRKMQMAKHDGMFFEHGGNIYAVDGANRADDSLLRKRLGGLARFLPGGGYCSDEDEPCQNLTIAAHAAQLGTE